ncbi:hypothetical protein [Lactococcus petauri]|uniref:hypothetical protein n=1 Tax=Lactococcus petauri TaxID=1940789 RepID=UPI00254B060F|nr:hypothetical protein [Lactococcus petauri]
MSNSVRTMTVEEVQKVLERKNHEIRLLTAHVVEQNSLIEDLRSDLNDAEQDYYELEREYDRLNEEAQMNCGG